MSRWRPIDLMLMLMVATVCGIMFAAIVSSVVFNREMPEDRADLVGGVIASMISIVSMYIGASIHAAAARAEVDAMEANKKDKDNR